MSAVLALNLGHVQRSDIAYVSKPDHTRETVPAQMFCLAWRILSCWLTLQAKVLASTAYEAATTEQGKGVSVCILARIYHSADNMQEAFKYYSQAGLSSTESRQIVSMQQDLICPPHWAIVGRDAVCKCSHFPE